MDELLEIKNKLHLITDIEYKTWAANYRDKIRARAQKGGDWPADEFILFAQITDLYFTIKTIEKSLSITQVYDFSEVFFEFFTREKIAEMVKKTPKKDADGAGFLH
jgi:hypothetical protein